MTDLIHYAIPGFILLITIEVIITTVSKKNMYRTGDAITSIALGLGNVITGLVGKGLVLAALTLVYKYLRITEAGFAWWVWVLAFFAEDFSYYLFHRCSHHVRYLWASHVVYHSSQHYNLSTALRQTWTGNFTGTFIFWCWMPLAGFHPLMIVTLQATSLLYQFWIHTEVIGKLPRWIEFIFNTPSHHRVHHSSELEYLDKNHAGVLIIWDRLFGSFQAEKSRPVYGLTKNVSTGNPVSIAFHEWGNLFQDLRKSKSVNDAVKYIVNPPGWSHDGRSMTTAQLRKRKLAGGDQNTTPGTNINKTVPVTKT